MAKKKKSKEITAYNYDDYWGYSEDSYDIIGWESIGMLIFILLMVAGVYQVVEWAIKLVSWLI